MRIRAFREAGALAVAAVLTFALPEAVEAKTLRWSSQDDFLTMNLHAQNEALNNSATGQVYEPLINRDKAMKLDPSLATEWKQEEPTRWRFKLRQNVKFHDGTPFTADDVVFSVQRVMAPTSNFKQDLTGVAEARKVDDHTVDIITNGPNPVLLQQLTEVRIMSKAWSEKNNVTKPQNFVEKEETFAVRNMNGTGPYMLKSREVDIRTVFVEKPNWWGKRDGIVNQIKVETDQEKRNAMIVDALEIHNAEVAHVPLHHQVIPWAMRSNINVVHRADNRLELRWTQIN